MLQSTRVVTLGIWCCVLACALAACASHTVEDASWSDGALRRRVSYAGLDLNSVAGARMLLLRLKAAAGEVCEPLDGPDLRRHQRWHACSAQALRDAVRQVNHPMVTIQYQGSVSTAMLRQTGVAP
jgi:UrcA family protein